AEEQLASELKALLNADTTAMRLWMNSQESNAATAAQTPLIQQSIEELATIGSEKDVTAANLLQSPAEAKLRMVISAWTQTHGYVGYVVIGPDHLVLASNSDALVGEKSLPGYVEFATVCLKGAPIVSRPFPSVALIEDDHGRKAAGLP